MSKRETADNDMKDMMESAIDSGFDAIKSGWIRIIKWILFN